MKSFMYGFLAALLSILSVCAAWFARKAENATEALKERDGELTNERGHNEATQRREKIDEHVNGLDDEYIRNQLRKRTNGNG
jgi:predicted DNA-binding protein